ncbi:tetratricopeptide repeat protein [Myxococcota bacterium]|nr:tetratricopeptide repeat protein [Myxococcota bacterium]
MIRPAIGRTGAAAVLSLLVALALGCQSDEQRLAEHLARAESYAAEGQASEALLELRNALRIDPQSAEINARIAELLKRQEQYEDALFFYREAHRLAPDQSEAALQLARLLLGNDLEEAKALAEDVLAREPDNSLAHIVRSEVALAEGDGSGALQHARRVVELEPDSFAAHMHLGVTYRALLRGRTLGAESVPAEVTREAALAALERGIELAEQDASADPSWPARAWMERGLLLAGWEERKSEAAAAFRRAVEVAEPSPEAESTALEAAITYARQAGDPELQRWALERRVARDPARLADWAALARLAQQTDGSGLEALRPLLEQRPQDAAAQVMYGRYLERWKSPEAADEYLHGAAERTDQPAVVRAALVDLRVARGDLDGARSALAELQREHAESPETRFAEAYLAFVDGDLTRAAERLRELSTSTQSAAVERLLAQTEQRLGRPEAALAALARARDLGDPQTLDLLRIEASIHIAAAAWTEALQTIQRLQQARQGTLNFDEAVWLAQARYRTGQAPAARAVLEDLLAKEHPPADAALLFAREESVRDPERTREVLETARVRFPDDVRVVDRLVRLDIAEGHLDEARTRLDGVLAKAPDAVPLLVLRARIRAMQGDFDAALVDARRAFERAEGGSRTGELLVALLTRTEGVDKGIEALEAQRRDGTLATSGRLLLARLRMERGEHAEAIELLEQVLADAPQRAGAKNDLAYLLAVEGRDLERALQLAQEARGALPDSAAIADTLGFVMLRRGLPDAALAQFRSALELAGSAQEQEDGGIPPSYRYHLGLAYKALDRPDDAVRAFEEALAGTEDFPEAAAARSELAALRAPQS